MLKRTFILTIATLMFATPTNAGKPFCEGNSGASDAGTFTATGPMTSARSLHTATLLDNGKVLLVGGVGAGGSSATFLNTAEIYDPKRREFVATASMSTARLGAAAVRLRDGRVLVVGGENNSQIAVNSAEIYNPVTGKWKLTAPMSYARENPTATLLMSGKVLIVGGYSVDGNCCALSSAEIFDPKTGTFSTTGFMAVARRNHTATLLKNGRVLVAGGYNGVNGDSTGSGNVNAPELYDPATGTFDATDAMSSARRYPTATMLMNGQVLIAGGGDSTNAALAPAETYKSRTAIFTVTGSLLTPRARHTATRLLDGKVLITGGYGDGGTTTVSAELYDPVTEKFSATGSMAVARYRHTETRLLNGDVLIAGGSEGNSAVASAEIYHAPGNHRPSKACRVQ